MNRFAAETTPPEISCRAANTFALYFAQTYGEERLRKAYARLGTSLPLEYVIEPRNFLSFEFTQRFLDLLADESGDAEFARKAGLFVATPAALGFMFHMLRALGTPRAAYEKLVDTSPTYNRVGQFTIESLSDTHLRLRYSSRIPEPNRRACATRMGQFASVPTVWGLREAHVIEHSCQVKGDDCCHYELTWEPMRKPLLSAAGGGLAGAACGAVHLSAVLPVSASAFIGLVLGASIAAALSYRSQARLQRELLNSQSEGLVLSLRDLQSRFEEIQQFNATLEQKVEDRTRELRETSAKLRDALDKQIELDRMKTRFFQNISHELRTPLTLVLSPVDYLLSAHDLEASQREQLETVRRSGSRLLSLINSLLDISRLDAAKMRLSLEDVDPAGSVRQLVESAQPLARERGIALEYQGPECFGDVPLDTDKFEKCVLNLISNALKFTARITERTPRVEVEVGREDDWLVVTVRDNGIGIPHSDLEAIFERFHQVDGTDQRQYGGTGIGLSLVKEFTEFHCGTVSVSSVEGQGATFTLRYPTSREAYPADRLDRRRASEEVSVDRRVETERRKLARLIANPADLVLADLKGGPPPAPALVSGESGRNLVLIADDNPDMASYLATILAREYDVLTAKDGAEALEIARERVPHVVVSDVMMPRMNGHALVQALRRSPQTRTIPVILVTAKADAHQRVEGIDFGADDYLTKPFNFLELRARIRQLLRARSLERMLVEKNRYLEKVNFDLVLSKKEVFVQTVEALAFALDAKDPYTHGHSRRVAILSAEVARGLSLTEAEIERVRLAAVLHDIGKLGVPEWILRKEGALTPEEEEIVRSHPAIGYRILESVRELAEMNRCILHHHERFDGTGYPAGRKGIEIPVESRIIAVADTYDAMTTDRPYRKGVPHARAIQELEAFSGSQFDPICVQMFLQLYGACVPEFPETPSVFTPRDHHLLAASTRAS